MNLSKLTPSIILAVVLTGLAAAAEPSTSAKTLTELQRDLVNQRFGMFIHFSPTTYLDPADHLHSDHAPPRQGKDGIAGTADDLSPALVNPTKLDCGQWADAAKSAGTKFAVLTTKHHDGFCLWPSKYSTYTVAQGCKRDIVREFTDAFRKRGLKVGLYYSIRDRTERISGVEEQGGVSPEKIQLIKNQLTELLTNYGEILYIVFDAWGNNWHESPTFSDILEHGSIFVSEEPFRSDDPTEIRHLPGVLAIAINEPPGYPTPYPIGKSGRFIRIMSDTGRPIGIGEGEVFAETDKPDQTPKAAPTAPPVP
jgi:hypothetical protein